MPVTASTVELQNFLRQRILAFTDGTTPTLATLLGTRVYQDAPPEAAPFPYVMLRIINSATSDYGMGDRLDFDVEVMVLARPRSEAQAAHRIADLIEGAFLRYQNTGGAADGLVYVHGRTRDTLPYGSQEVDREVVQIRLVFNAWGWMRYLMKQSVP